MESNIFSTSSEGGGPASKKRKITMNKSENQYEAEIVKLKQDLQEYQLAVAKQTITIARLEKEKDDNSSQLDDIDTEEIKAREEELQCKIALLEQNMEDERKKYETKLAELSAKVTDLERQHNEKNGKIENLELLLSSTQNSKPDPELADKIQLLEDKNNELQLKYDDSDKKTKELELEIQSKVSTESFLQKTIEDTQKDNAEKLKLSQNQMQLKCDDYDKKIKGLQTQLESKTKEAFNFQEQVSKLEAARKDSINKNVHLMEIERLKEKHEKEVKEKLELAAEKAETEINGLKANTEDLTKKLSNEKLIRLQGEIKELNDKLSVAKSNEEKLNSKIVEITKKELDARTIITEQEKKIQASNAPQFFSLNEIHNGSARERLSCNAVVTVEKLSQKNGILSLYSAETSVEPFTWELSRRKPWFKIHVNDEFEIGSSQFLTTTLRYIHSAKLTKLDLNYHSIDFGDFKKLVSSYTIKTFIGGPVYRINVDGEKVNLRLDEILKELPNIETCEIYQGDMSSNAVEYKKLTKLPRFMKLQKFTFRDLSSLFNVLNFTGFIKTNPNVSFVLKYNYVSRIQKNNIRTREKQLRESLPSNCNVVVEY